MFDTLQRYKDVPVVPAVSLHQHVPHGGPIWPHFDLQSGLRHCRDGVAVDKQPRPAKGAEQAIKVAVWGGCLDRHFGHFMAEHLPRLPFALHKRPDDLYIFTVEPGTSAQDVPEWMWALLAWVGLPRAQVRLITQATRVTRLHGGFQAEMLPQVAPADGYLDLLAALAEAQALPATPADLVYVTRAGLPRTGAGGNAGETYLVDCLKTLGIPVLDPATSDLTTQMAGYAGARHLVFAEGSALHGRQLLGRLPQRVTVLRRRRGRSMARGMLTPRVQTLTYQEVTARVLIPQSKAGRPIPDPALALYDLPALMAGFAEIGVDLASVWDQDAYRAAAQSDLDGWIAHRTPSADLADSYRHTLTGSGLALPPPETRPA